MPGVWHVVGQGQEHLDSEGRRRLPGGGGAGPGPGGGGRCSDGGAGGAAGFARTEAGSGGGRARTASRGRGTSTGPGPGTSTEGMSACDLHAGRCACPRASGGVLRGTATWCHVLDSLLRYMTP